MEVATYGELLRRKRGKMTIRELANTVGTDYHFLRDIIVNSALPDRDLNDRLCRVLGVDPNDAWILVERQMQSELKRLERSLTSDPS